MLFFILNLFWADCIIIIHSFHFFQPCDGEMIILLHFHLKVNKQILSLKSSFLIFILFYWPWKFEKLNLNCSMNHVFILCFVLWKQAYSSINKIIVFLKHPIIIGKKKYRDVQMFTEVRRFCHATLQPTINASHIQFS